MFGIRRIYDNIVPINIRAITQVQDILRTQFPSLQEKDIVNLPERLQNPLKYRFRSILFVAEGSKGQVNGFALLLHAPDLNFCYLDYISTIKESIGRGIGGALYERIREEAVSLKTIGIFFESLPDDPKLCHDPKILQQNIARLRFYERYGARPIVNTKYEMPLKSGDDNPPYLVYDDLGQDINLRAHITQAIVHAILDRKYGKICSKDYVNTVINSFKDDPVRLREPRYVKKIFKSMIRHSIPTDKKIAMVVTDQHIFHHIHERGYVESPVRINSILKEFEKRELFHRFPPKHFSEKYIKSVHDAHFIDYFRKICDNLESGRSIYPYVFPIRNKVRPPKELAIRAGYYCLDTFTPLNRNAYLAAKRAVDCSLTATQKILEGYRLAYALVRPPGHHAERRSFGGFCYFNSVAIVAQYLCKFGKVAILDIDYHHGNGQQNIFYERSDVLTISIHGHPSFAYPYFSGFKDEKGLGPGEGYNINIPLPENVSGSRYQEILVKVLKRVKKFQPIFLVIALGLDTAKGDPTGTWSLNSKDFELNGKIIGSLKIPTIVIQEGGYNNRLLGINALHFFIGLWTGTYANGDK